MHSRVKLYPPIGVTDVLFIPDGTDRSDPLPPTSGRSERSGPVKGAGLTIHVRLGGRPACMRATRLNGWPLLYLSCSTLVI
jgi:hypothetical protein